MAIRDDFVCFITVFITLPAYACILQLAKEQDEPTPELMKAHDASVEEKITLEHIK